MKVSYVCSGCFTDSVINNEQCAICNSNEYLEFIKLDNWEFKSIWHRKWIPQKEYFERIRLLSKFSEEQLRELNATVRG
jgi:hypothetical protein